MKQIVVQRLNSSSTDDRGALAETGSFKQMQSRPRYLISIDWWIASPFSDQRYEKTIAVVQVVPRTV